MPPQAPISNETLQLFADYLTQLISFFAGIATGLAFSIASKMRWGR